MSDLLWLPCGFKMQCNIRTNVDNDNFSGHWQEICGTKPLKTEWIQKEISDDIYAYQRIKLTTLNIRGIIASLYIHKELDSQGIVFDIKELLDILMHNDIMLVSGIDTPDFSKNMFYYIENCISAINIVNKLVEEGYSADIAFLQYTRKHCDTLKIPVKDLRFVCETWIHNKKKLKAI